MVNFFYMHIKSFGPFFIFFCFPQKQGSVGSVLPEIKLVWPKLVRVDLGGSQLLTIVEVQQEV